MMKNTAEIVQVDTSMLFSVDSTFKDTLLENIDVSLSALSDKNRADYDRTFQQWQAFAKSNDHPKLDFNLILVRDFLSNDNWSFNTRKVKLAHLRKYAEILALSDKDELTDFAYNYGRLSLLKPKSLGGKKDIINHRSLSDKQVYTLFDSVSGTSNRDMRDTAILGLLLFAGLRSSETVSLQWQDCDFANKLIFVREGKGDKSANVPMLGDLRTLLLNWQYEQSKHGAYDYVVCSVYRSDKLGGNSMCNSGVIGTMIKRLSKDTGINFRPHDTRRTAITTLLDGGANVANVRDFARHSNGDTTLGYAVKNDAKALGSILDKKFKIGSILDDLHTSKNTLIYGCDNGHIFKAFNPEFCAICGNTTLSEQLSLDI